MRSLLVFSRDPGPTNQLVAGLEALRMQPQEGDAPGLVALRHAVQAFIDNVQIAARMPGEQMWRDAGWQPMHWECHSEADARNLLAESKAGVLITGSSDVDEPADRTLWPVAREIGVETHVMIDHPANLGRRFSGRDGEQLLPDWIYAPDDVFAQRLVAAGLPQERIRIVGDLHHDRVRRLAAAHRTDDIAALRAQWGVGREVKVVLFASECAREMAAAGRPSPYDEVEMLERLARHVASGNIPDIGVIDPAHTAIVVRPHPRDRAGKYDAIAARYVQQPRLTISAAGTPDLAIAAADLVAGMNSSLLYEAMELRRPVVSLSGHDIRAGKSRSG